jgi:PAS domain S-box-containing protein
VWLVDGCPTQLAQARQVLSAHHAVETFSDAEQMLKRLSLGPPPGALLLDWQLPGLSGLDACRRVREHSDGVTLPILMLSRQGTHEDFTEGLQAGANDFVAKPFHDAELLARVASLLRIRAQGERLKEREAYWATTLSSIGDAVITTDPAGRVVFLNPAAERLTGWSTPEAQQRPVAEVFRIIDAATREPLASPVEQALALGTVQGLVGPVLLVRRDGSEVPIDDSAAPIRAGAGAWVGAVLIFRDITERRKEDKPLSLAGAMLDITARKAVEAEKEELARQVRASEAHLRLVMNALPVLVSFVDAQERYGFVNKAYEEWFGLSCEALTGRTVLEVIGPAAYAVLGPYVKRGLAGEHFTFEQFAVPYRLGGTRDVRVSFTPLYDASGQPDGYVAMLQDITLQRRLQHERDVLLRREEEARAEAESARSRLAKFVENAPSAMGTVRGPDHVFEMVNPKYRELMGAHRPLLGRPMAQAAPEVVDQGYIRLFDTVYRTGEPYVAEAVPAMLDRGGNGELEEFFFNLAFQPARGPDGTVDGVDVFGFEVTSQVRLRQREEELKRLAEERSAFEQQLIGIVSHDLRNPLSAILFATSTLSHGPALDERSTKSVRRISAAAERANRLVKDLLDFTQARLGKGIPLYTKPMDVAQALRGWVEEVGSAFPQREVHVHIHGDGHAHVDPDRMAQVVGNLVSNAFKYSPPNTAVDVRLRGEPQALVLEVHNRGIPIPEAQQASIFQPLERGQDARDMTSRSVGLGLFIVKHVVEAHRGHIDVISTEVEGTTFIVRLPR